ncbi:MAG: AAA family ATPase, partial [Saprospiraceae bacterium]
DIDISKTEIEDFLEKNFTFFLVEASNIDIPKLISEIVNDEILPIGLDRRRGSLQKDSLIKLTEFIDKSKEAVGKIENELTAIFQSLFNNVESIDTENWKLKINFPEYNFLREAISSMISFTLFDTNNKELESKGSGIQRIILLSLIQFLNEKSRKNIIWAIDEPEAYLQPSLQKSLFSKFIVESQKNTLFIATHSTFFIDLNNLKNTFLFEGTKEVKDTYVRVKNKVFYKVHVVVDNTLSNFEKAQRIKSHFGIIKNDAWEIMPFNILVEGQEDKDYLIALLNLYNFPIPNILVAGGVPKFAGYLQFINDYCSELNFKPEVVAIYDKDSAGRQEYNSLNSDSKKRKMSNIKLDNEYVIRFDGTQFDDIEMEDLLPVNVIIDSANKILKKHKFSIIKQNDRAKRTLPVYNRRPVLNFLNEMVRANNQDKHELSFDTLEMKLALSQNICKQIQSDEKTIFEFKNNIKIKEFLKRIINNCG